MLIPTWLRADKTIARKFWTTLIRMQAGSVGEELHVNGRSHVTGNTFLGNNVNFNGLSVLGIGKVVIGNNFHSGPECLLIAQSHDFDQGEAIPYGSHAIAKDITIEDNVWLGARVIVIGNARIGEGAIIQAGSCVVTDIAPYAIAGGHPARVFSSRNRERYERLKSAGRFL